MREFQNTCPKRLKKLPEKDCVLGQVAVMEPDRNSLSCDWFINSPEDAYCFFRWLHRNSLPGGRLTHLRLIDIQKLLKISQSEVHEITEQGLEKIQKHPLWKELVA